MNDDLLDDKMVNTIKDYMENSFDFPILKPFPSLKQYLHKQSVLNSFIQPILTYMSYAITELYCEHI